jgi:hypothetical protein
MRLLSLGTALSNDGGLHDGEWRQVPLGYAGGGDPAGGAELAAGGNGNRATQAVFLLLKADLDSVSAVRSTLTSPEQLRKNLRGPAQGWAVVAPGEDEIGAWGRHLGVPRR